MGKTCVAKGIFDKLLRYNDLRIRNIEGNFDSNEELLEMRELFNDITKDIYVYKNLRGIIVFIDRFKKQNKYFSKKSKTINSKKEAILVSNAEYKSSNEMSPTEEYAKNWENLTDKEEILDEEEIRQAYGYGDDGDYGYTKIK